MPFLYGLAAVIAGLLVLLVVVLLIVVNATNLKNQGADSIGYLAVAAVAVVGMVGPFFGVAIGLQFMSGANKERAAAEAGKDAVQLRAERYLAYLDPETAKTLVQ
jgi:hypothetical protein